MFDRLEFIIGSKINLLKSKTIMVIGLGGVGGHAFEALVRSGIENIIVIDNDVIDITNLNRQALAFQNTIGKPKVEIAKQISQNINSNCQIISYQIFLDEENINDINFAMQLSKFMDSSFIRFWNVEKIMILTHKIILLLPLIDGTGLLYVYTQIIHQILKTSFFYKEFVLSSPDITILMDKLKPLIDHKLFLVKIPQLILVIMQHSPDAHQYLYGIFGFSSIQLYHKKRGYHFFITKK